MPVVAPSGGLAGGGKKTAAAPQSGPGSTEKQVLRLAGRLVAKDPSNTAYTQQQLGKVFAGYSPKKIRQLSAQVGLPGYIGQGLANNAQAEKSAGPGGILGGFLQGAGAFGQGVLGGVSEGSLEGVKKGLLSEESYTPVQAFSRGILGQSKQQAVKTEKGLGGWAAPINFVGSVATDPLTYLSFGTTSVSEAAARQAAEKTGVPLAEILTKGTKAFTKDQIKGLAQQGGKTLLTRQSKTLKALRGAPGGVKIGGKTVINTRKLTNNLGKRLGMKYAKSDLAANVGDVVESGFRTGATLKQAARRGEEFAQNDLPHKVATLFRNSEGRVGLETKQFEAQVGKALKDNRIGPKDYDAIRDALDVGPSGVLTPAQEVTRTKFRGFFDDMLRNEREAGVPTVQLGTRGAELGQQLPGMETPIPDYFPHYATEQKPGQGGGLFSKTEPGFTQGRQVEGSISEVNARAGRDVFNPDLVGNTLRRGRGSIRAVERKRVFDELGTIEDGTGSPLLRPKTEGEVVPAGMKEIKIRNPEPGLPDQSFLVNDAIHADVDRYATFIQDDKAIENATKLIDKVNQIWRQYAVASPGFISRNVFQGNIPLASFMPPSGARATLLDYTRAARLQKKIRDGLKDSGDLFAKLSRSEKAAVRDAYETGALTGGFFPSADLAAKTVAKPALRDLSAGEAIGRTAKASNPLSSHFAPTAALRNVNEAAENNARLALFLHNREVLGKNGAADIVNKYLFDYRDLTKFESKGIKRISPFYTWMRKNLPLQMETLVKNPGRFSRNAQVRQVLGQQFGLINTQPVPSYLDTAIKVGNNPETVYSPDMPWDSAADYLQPLASIGHGDWRKAVSQVASNNTGGLVGILYTAALAAAGKNSFTGADFKPGARVDSVLGKIDPALLSVLESALPALQRAKAFSPQTAADQANQKRRLISWLGGVTLNELNDKTRNSALYELLQILQAKQQTEKDTGSPIPVLKDIKGYKTPKRITTGKKSSSGVIAP